MADIAGTNVVSPIRPFTDADEFPTAYATEIKGGHHTVATLVARDAIPSLRRLEGMFCYVQENGKLYYLSGGITNTDWLEYTLTGEGPLYYRGSIDCSTNPNYPAADQGDSYKISAAGKIGGASGATVGLGDLIICTTNDTPSGDQATVGSFWDIILASPTGTVIGPSGAVDGNFVAFDGATGALVKDSGYSQADFAADDHNHDGDYVATADFVINDYDEKVTPVDGDVLLIEDSEDTYAKKKILMSTVLGGGAGSTGMALETFTLDDESDNVHVLSEAPAGQVLLFLNGMYLVPDENFTLVGSTITIDSEVQLAGGMVLNVFMSEAVAFTAVEAGTTLTLVGQKNYFEVAKNHGMTGGAIDCALADGNIHIITPNAACTFTFTATGASGNFRTLVLIVAWGGTTYTLNWPTVKWSNGTSPTGYVANHTSIFTFFTYDDGTTWYGACQGLEYY